MFATGPQQILQQQFMQGCSVGQQGYMWEMQGNLQGACQCYDQAAAILTNCVATAQQYMVPIDAQGWFSLAWCHFNAARTKTMLGWGMAAPAHLGQAQMALNNAISMNPMFGPYHSAMGVLLAATGQAAPAMYSFMRAVQLNPADAFSQYMLAVLNQAQGNVAAGNQFYAAAQQYAAPGLPAPAQTIQAQGGGKSGGLDWNGLIGTIGEVMKFVNGSGFFSNAPSQDTSNSGYTW
jgi:tetratricopeptide (TPR) repeat protein